MNNPRMYEALYKPKNLDQEYDHDRTNGRRPFGGNYIEGRTPRI